MAISCAVIVGLAVLSFVYLSTTNATFFFAHDYSGNLPEHFFLTLDLQLMKYIANIQQWETTASVHVPLLAHT